MNLFKERTATEIIAMIKECEKNKKCGHHTIFKEEGK